MQLAMQSLGFSDMGRLYEIYAAHIAFERGIRNDTPMYLNLSDKFIGTDLKDARKAEIMQTHLLGAGSHFYFHRQLEALARCAQSPGSTQKEALRLCFCRILAKILAQTFATLLPTEPVSDTSFFDKPIEALIKQCDVDKEITIIEASAVNHSICNIQSKQSASYAAEFSLSAESNQRSALSESPKTLKHCKGLTSIFTPKISGPLRRKSCPQISKKNNKDSNEPGFVYNPPAKIHTCPTNAQLLHVYSY
ncbi:hypothetical protein BY996DRAFT_6414371 [Phakopsora pachyrhizi]|nr:hypothetical protein BY996DRAFT_6414371 [Phakopsora pachyrhizi]